MGDNSDAAHLRGDTESDNRITGALILCNGENVPQEIPLSGKMKTFGRAVNNDVVCNCLQISRKHAAFEYKNNKWFLIDMSTNGLSINGRKIDKGVASELTHNDVILFIPTGALQYRFEYVVNGLLPNSTAATTPPTNTLQPFITVPEPSNFVSVGTGITIPKPVVNLANSRDDDEFSNHSESLLNGEEFPVINITSDESGFAGFECRRSPTKTNQYSNQKLNGKETRAKRPHANFDEPGSSSAKRKYVTKDIKSTEIEELEQELPDIDDLADGIPEAQELPDLDDDIESFIPPPPQNQKIQSSKDILTCDDINVLRRRCLECMQKLENQEAASQIQLFEKNIEYQKLFDKYNETESKAEVQKEELFKLVMDAMEREFGCCICNEIFIEATVIECGHTFCHFCISEWQRRNPECPICRAPTKKQTKHKEMENYIVTIHSLMSEEIRSKRELTLLERKKAIEKAEAEHLAAPRGRRGAIGDLGADHNIIEFLTDMHMNQMFRVRDISRPRRGHTRGAASTSRRSTRLQNQVADPPVAAGARARGRGVGGRRGTRRAGATPAETVTTNAIEVASLPLPPPVINPAIVSSNAVFDQQPGPSRFMGFLGMVQRAAARAAAPAAGRAAAVNLFSEITNPSSSGAAPAANMLQNASASTLPTLSERIAPRLSESVVLLSSDDDLELIDEALGGGRTRSRRANAPLSIDFFANPEYDSSDSDTSDDEN